jgi:hypothetical protein
MRNYFFFFACILVSGCNSHAYFNEGMQYMAETEKLLVEQRVCAGSADCSSKGIVFWEAGGWAIGPFKGGGVYITVYKISDLRIAEKIIEGCKTIHSRIPDVPVTVTIFSNAHIDNLHEGTSNVVAHAKISSAG